MRVPSDDIAHDENGNLTRERRYEGDDVVEERNHDAE